MSNLPLARIAQRALRAILFAATALAMSLSCAVAQESAPVKQEASCVQCHEQQQGQLHAPVAQWRDSVHGKAGVTCDGCHGGDAKDASMAHSPTAGFVGRPRLRDFPYMCGKCHSDIKDVHVGSVHGKNGLPHCVTCHGSHAIQPPDPAAIITEAECSKCHPFEKAKTAQAMLQKARGLVDELDTFAKSVEHISSVIQPLRQMQKELRLDRDGVLATFHSFRIGEIQQIGGNVDRVMKTIAKLREREEQRESNYARERPVILSLVAFFLLAAAFGYRVYHGNTPLPQHDHGDHG